MDAIISQLRECFGRVAYSHKTHEKCSDIYHGRLNRLKLLQIFLSVATTGTLIRVLFEQGKAAAIVAAVLSAALLAVNTYAKNYDLGALAQKHADTAAKLWEVRESYLSLLTDAEAGVLDHKQVLDRRDKLQDRLAAIYKGAPRTLDTGYAKAQQALQTKEELTFSDEEIDKFLPKPLRKATAAPPSSSTPAATSAPASQGPQNIV